MIKLLKKLFRFIFKKRIVNAQEMIIIEKIINPICRGIFGNIFTVLVTLKITNYIDWSWWIVFSPFIISPIVGLIITDLFLKFFKNNLNK